MLGPNANVFASQWNIGLSFNVRLRVRFSIVRGKVEVEVGIRLPLL